MSSADPTEVRAVVTGDGITVEKSFEPDDFPVPAIAFVVQSRRDEQVSVRLTDSVPEGVSPEDIGFHPKYGAEHWSVTGNRIVFEREFESGEEYTTVYGLRSDTDDIQAYLAEPELESVDPPLDDAQQAVHEVGSDEESQSGATESETPGESGEDGVPSLDLTDPGDDEGVESAVKPVDEEDADTDEERADTDEVASTDAARTDESDRADAGGSTADSDTANGLVAALAAEIRSGDVSDEDLRPLREAFGGGDGSATTDARIKRLQTEFADLRAYTDEIEAFLDQFDGMEEELSAIQSRMDDVQSQVDAVGDRSSENAERIESIDADLAAVDDEVATAAERAEQAHDRAEIAEETATAVESDIDTLNEEITAVREEFDAVYDDIDDLQERMDGIELELDDVAQDAETAVELADRLDDLESEFRETHDSLTGRLEEVDEDIEALSEMRDRLTSAFGPPSDSSADSDGE